MDTLIRILMEIDDSTDWINETGLIDRRLLDSFAVITLIPELEAGFGIHIRAAELTPENFNSAKAIWCMIQRLQEK